MRVLGGVCVLFFLCTSAFAASFGSVAPASERAEKMLGLPSGFLAGYTVTFPVDAGPTAPVIVHIGQVHEDARGAEYSQKARDMILGNQQSIKTLLQQVLKGRDVPCVFAEGFASWSPQVLEKARKDRDALITAVNLRAQQSGMFYIKDLDVFEKFITKIKTFRQYNDAEINVRVYDVIVTSLERKSLSAADSTKVQAARAKLTALKSKYGGEPNMLMSGAVNALFFDHSIKAICATEDEKANAAAEEALARANALSRSASSLERSQANKAAENAVLTVRDDVVQRYIRQAPISTRKGGVVVAVFGEAHDWTNATMLANEEPGAKRYSYIKITPKPTR
jgi:hypothetical protein